MTSLATKKKTKELSALVDRILKKYEVIGPIHKKSQFVFNQISSFDEMVLDYSTTILPPKKFLIPQKENLLSFERADGFVSEEPQLEKKQVLFGIHSCDLNAFSLLDKVFTDANPCPRYAKRRNSLILVALTCNEPSEYCFCESMGTGPSPSEGYDLLLTDLGNEYLAESGSDAGEELIHLFDGESAGTPELKKKETIIESAKKKFKRRINTQDLPKIFQKNLDHPVWKKLGEIDLACAQCIYSCPTCYCFDVRDDINLTLDSGTRYKEWDACFLKEFSEVALEGNFRKDRAARVRQFMGHNLGWGGSEQYQFNGSKLKCVGCGRCIRACPVGIDITEVAAIMRGEKDA